MTHTTLVSTVELATHLDDPDWRIIDCRFDLVHPEAGEAAYHEGHIPTALYAHLDHDLSGPITATSGRHPLPDPERLVATFGTWGIGANTQVVCYDAQTNAYAARLWWLLRWLGHPQVAVLDGGLEQWEEEGRPLNAPTAYVVPTEFRGKPDSGMLIRTADLEAHLNSAEYRLIDVRGPERYRGEKEPIDSRAGHIPGALNLPYQSNLDSCDCFLPPEALKKMYQRVIGDSSPGKCIFMCGSGVTACHSLIALEMAGLSGAKLYAGSWSEWIRDPRRPVETSAR